VVAGRRRATGREPTLLDVAFASPRPGQVNERPVVVGKVHDGAHRTAHGQRGITVVPDGDAPGDRRQVAEHRVAERDDDARAGVAEVDLERLGLVVRLDIRGGKGAELRLARRDSVAGVGELEDGRAIRLLDDEAGRPVVAAARRRALQGDGIAQPVREAVERSRQQVPVRLPRGERPAEMEGPQRTVLMDREDEAQLPVRQVELAIPLAPLGQGHAAGVTRSDQRHS
jgi:hypothetical protein